MRKRFVTTIILCILCALCAFGVTACDGGKTEEPVSVSGKTFVFVSVHGEYPEGASDETKEEWNGIFKGTNEEYKDNLLWIFAEDGTWKQVFEEEEILKGTYVQNGSLIEFTEDHGSATVVGESSELKISGKTFTYSVVIGDAFTQVQTFKLLEE